MHQRPIIKYLPGIERLEEKQLLSPGSLSADVSNHKAASSVLELRSPRSRCARHRCQKPDRIVGPFPSCSIRAVATSFLVFRITNPRGRPQ